jgi:hypothetical protein
MKDQEINYTYNSVTLMTIANINVRLLTHHNPMSHEQKLSLKFYSLRSEKSVGDLVQTLY